MKTARQERVGGGRGSKRVGRESGEGVRGRGESGMGGREREREDTEGRGYSEWRRGEREG